MSRRVIGILLAAFAVYGLLLTVFLVNSKRKKEAAVSVEPITTLSIWYWDNSVEEAFRRFAGERKDIELQFTYMPNYEYADNLSRAVAMGETLPDICVLQADDLPALLNLPVWEDLSAPPYNAEKNALPRESTPFIYADNGKLIALPYNIPAGGIAYHSGAMKRIFDIDEPEELSARFPTWEALIDESVARREESGEEFWLFSGIGDIASMLLRQTDASYLNGTTLADPQRVLHMFEVLCSLRDNELVGNISQCSPQWYDTFSNPSYLFSPWATWLLQNGAFEKTMAQDWRVALPPEGGYAWGASFFAIPQQSKVKAAAWEFLDFWLLSEQGAEFHKEMPHQFLCSKVQSLTDDYCSMPLAGYGGQDVGEIFFDVLLPSMRVRPPERYTAEIDAAYEKAVELIANNPEITA
ncbi:MAG: extracellular solute-binding protein, partial [Angelakisella sp.]